MKFIIAIVTFVLFPASEISACAAPLIPVEETDGGPSPPNPFSDACASVAAFMIAPEVFQKDDEKNLSEWVRVCNAHPDQNTCKDTIKLIAGNMKDVPVGLTCGPQI